MLHPFVWLYAPVAVQIGRKVAVTHYDGVGEALVQPLQEAAHASTLCLGARVAGMARRVQSTLISDAYGVCIMVLTVGPHLAQRTPSCTELSRVM